MPTWKLVIDPLTSSLYIGTDNGVYVLNGGVGQWSRLGSGMPEAQVRDLFLDPATDTLTAGSYGRSEFQILLGLKN